MATLCVDFDGVLHWYRNGWTAPEIIDDLPTPGAVEFITEALKWFDVVVFSTRCKYPAGIRAMQNWMRHYEFPEGVTYSATKVMAKVYLDDRGWQFNGKFPAITELRKFKTWVEREQ